MRKRKITAPTPEPISTITDVSMKMNSSEDLRLSKRLLGENGPRRPLGFAPTERKQTCRGNQYDAERYQITCRRIPPDRYSRGNAGAIKHAKAAHLKIAHSLDLVND